MRLIAGTPDKYASRNGSVAMEFNRGCDAGDMLMSYVPQQNMAEVFVVRANMACAEIEPGLGNVRTQMSDIS